MSRFAGILLAAFSAAAFGTLAIFYRYADRAGLDDLTLLALRFGLAALLMLILLAVRRERPPRGRVLLRLVAMGAIGYVGQSYLYLTALKYASAGLVALLLYLYPVFVAVLSMLVLGERLTGRKGLALGLALAGTALTAGPAGGQMLGVLLAIAAAVIYSVYIILGAQAMRHVSVVQSSAVIFSSAAVVYGVLAAANGPRLPATGAGWAVVGATVVIATVLPVVAFLAGIERIGPTNASMLSTLEPVVTVLLAAVLFGDTPAPLTLAGGGLILAAVLILARSELRGTGQDLCARKR